ncbi:MAG: VWA domain-containing protein [Acidobacteriota bacterium]|nr:VWA domain-containing protein [Acidobacteriota bacterium]
MSGGKTGSWAGRQIGRGAEKSLSPSAYLPICLLPLLAICLSAYLPSAVHAQVKPATPVSKSPQQAFILRSQTNLVLVDVRVYDKSGKPVTDLKPSDFRVTEDGVQQTISDFSLENVDKLAQATIGLNEQPKVIDLQKLPPQVNAEQVLQDHRLLVVFFDLSSMQPDELMRALKASSDFVSNRMTPADLLAVVTYSASLRVLQDFTNDRTSLKKALHSILVGDQSSTLAAGGAIGEAGGTDANGMEIVTQDVSDAFTPDETEFNIFNTDEKLAAIESLATMLRNVPGRKSVLYFSSGITRTGQENQATLRAATDAANQADVSLYTMDARGLAALPPGGDASSSSPAGTGIYSGSAVASQVSSLQGSRETLASLASDTGGRTFYDLNDFSPAFDQVQKENSSYYLIGYSPANPHNDGRFRHIRVEVARQGLKVQARPGYFAPKSFRQFTRGEKENQLQQVMDLDMPFVDLPFVVETAYFRRPDKKFTVVLAAKIPGSQVAFMKKSGKRETEFDFAWKLTDAQNHVAGGLRDTLPVRLTDETYEEIIGSNLFYEGEITLPAGKYSLKVVVRENESGKIGTFEAPVVVTDVPDAGMGLSSIVLSNEVKSSDELERARVNRDKNSPLQVGDRSILPSVTRVFRTNQMLTVYLESYAGKTVAPTGNAAPPSVALVFFRHGRKFAEAGPFPGKLQKSSEQKATYFVQIPLEKFPKGSYTLQLNVLDPAIERVAFARVPLAIVPPPPRNLPPPATK